MKARKLLGKATLTLIWLRYSVGVPVERLRRDFKIDLSLPTFIRLIEAYEDSVSKEQSKSITDTIENSLFPIWLKEGCKEIQAQPKSWKYVGRFPLGAWLREDNEND